MKGFVILFLFLITLSVDLISQCQTIVPNGGFEEFSALPTDDCDWALATGWTNAATSSDCNSNNGTPDYYHVLGTGPFSALPSNYYANLNPFAGDAVMGIGGNLSFLADAREYISIPLTNPLIIGNEYELKFSMNCGIPLVGGNYTDGWGALLSNGAVYQATGTNGVINAPGSEFLVSGVFSSQEWQTFNFVFVADAAYDYVTLGNFFSDAEQTTTLFGVQEFTSLAYVFFDEVQIVDVSNTNLTADLSDVQACQGELISFTVNTQGGIAPFTYEWSSNSANSSDTESFIATTDEIVLVTVTDCNGTSAQAQAQVNLFSFDIDLGPDFELCNGPFILDATDTEISAYSWNTGQGTPSIQITQPGTYFVDANWLCGIASDTVQVDACPQVSVSLGPDQQICPGESVVLLAFVSNGVAPFNYEWSISNSPSINALNVAPQQTTSYSVSVTDAIGNTASDSIIISVDNTPASIQLGEDVVICPGDTAVLNANAVGFTNYTWSNGSNTASITVDSPGVYAIIATSNCVALSDTLIVISGEIVVPEFLSSVTFCEDSMAVIGPFIQNNENFQWIDNSSLEFPRKIEDPGLYTFQISDFCGLRTFNVTTDAIICDCDIYVPNSFTPDDDGLNDYFAPVFNCVFESYKLTVFNRWGEKFFEIDDPNKKWTGNSLNNGEFYAPNGIYYWQLTAQPDKSIDKGEPISMSGYVNLLR